MQERHTRLVAFVRPRVAHACAAIAACVLVAGSIVACQPIAAATVTHKVDSAWTSGYQATVTMRNDSPTTVVGWQLQLTLPHTVSSTWDAVKVRQDATTVVFGHPVWQPDIAPGQTVQFGYVAETPGARVEPSGCRLNSAPCTLTLTGGATSTTGVSTTSTAPSTTSSTTSTSTTVPGPGGEVPFAPYADTTLWPPPDLAALATASGARRFTLGFVVSGTVACTPSWGGVVDPASGHMASEISELRAMGGDVIVSFGGANGTELAQSCTSVASLVAAYQSIIDRYSLTSVDFDIEGAAVADPASAERRSQAIAMLQGNASAAGRRLDVSLTLPVLPSGLTPGGVTVVQGAVDSGVALEVVNIMVMDYGSGAAPDPEGQMGAYAIQAAQSLHGQLSPIYPGLTAAERWGLVGVTPMIGQNDVTEERFYVADAQQLAVEASTRGFGRLAMWSTDRDKPCPGGPSPYASPTCSGIDQSPWAFSQALLGT